MRDNLAACLDKIGLTEAGFSDHPDDPGGPTNHGITQKTLAAWRKHPVTVDDVKGLPQSEARDIIASEYAAPIQFDDLPSGLDYAVLDCSVNSGPDRAARLLQETMGMPQVAVDGLIGKQTLAKLMDFADVGELIEGYCKRRLEFVQSLANWGTFGKGWTSRIERVETDATALATGKALIMRPTVLQDLGQAKAGGAVKVSATRSGKAAIANVVTASVAATATVGAAANQAIPVLQPYADVALVRNIIIGLTMASAIATLVVAMQRSKNGGTT